MYFSNFIKQYNTYVQYLMPEKYLEILLLLSLCFSENLFNYVKYIASRNFILTHQPNVRIFQKQYGVLIFLYSHNLSYDKSPMEWITYNYGFCTKYILCTYWTQLCWVWTSVHKVRVHCIHGNYSPLFYFIPLNSPSLL